MLPCIFWLRVFGLSNSDIQWRLGCAAKVYGHWLKGVPARPSYLRRVRDVIQELGGSETKVNELWERIRL